MIQKCALLPAFSGTAFDLIWVMRTLDLREAAEFLGIHPNTLQARAKAGLAPGAKIGKQWRFLEVDLVEYFRGQYSVNQKKQAKEAPCHSIRSVKRGTSISPTMGSAFEEALGLPTRRQRSNSTTNLKLPSGSKPLAPVITLGKTPV
jgi:hypothetical protein